MCTRFRLSLSPAPARGDVAAADPHNAPPPPEILPLPQLRPGRIGPPLTRTARPRCRRLSSVVDEHPAPRLQRLPNSGHDVDLPAAGDGRLHERLGFNGKTKPQAPTILECRFS